MDLDSPSFFTPHSRALSLTLCVASLLATACQGRRSTLDVEQQLNGALGLPHGVAFRTEGTPIVAAEEAPESLPLADAVCLAIQASPELQAALARVRTAQAEADLASQLPNPVLDFVFRVPDAGGKVGIEAGLAADLLAVLQRPTRQRATGHRLEAAAASALATALDVVAETQLLYAEAQALEATVPLLDARLSVVERLRSVADTRAEVGEGARHDVTTLESQSRALAVESSRDRHELRLARLALARRIGTPSGTADWQLDEWSAPAAVPTNESAWITSALRRRPELLAMSWELLALGEELAVARWGALDGATVGIDAERDEGWAVGPAVSLPLPLFDSGSARKRRASAVVIEARHRYAEAQQNAVEEVRSALESMSNAQQNLERVTRDLIPLERRRQSEISEAYQQRAVDLTAVLLAEQGLSEAQATRIALERELTTALLRLERAVGGRGPLVNSDLHDAQREP